MDVLIAIIEAIDNPIMLSLVLIILATLFIFKNTFIKTVKDISQKTEVSKQVKVIALKNHDLFPTMNRVRYEVANMKFYTGGKFDEVKTRMCYDFTNHKVIQCSIRMEDLIEIPGIDAMSRNALKKLVFDEQNLMHQDYIKESEINYIVRLFESFRYDVVASFENRINAIFSNESYKNNFELMLAIFEMWAMGIDLLPRDMSTTFETLNGKFKDLKYNK
jgi:hypothetical protein